MRLSRQFQTCLLIFFFFLRKYFTRTKKHQTQTNDFHPLKRFWARKKPFPIATSFLFAYFCSIVLCLLVSVFVGVTSFRKTKKKEINRFEIVLIASVTYTSDVLPPLIHLSTTILTHLFLFVIICENLFFMRIILNLWILSFSW